MHLVKLGNIKKDMKINKKTMYLQTKKPNTIRLRNNLDETEQTT